MPVTTAPRDGKGQSQIRRHLQNDRSPSFPAITISPNPWVLYLDKLWDCGGTVGATLRRTTSPIPCESKMVLGFKS